MVGRSKLENGSNGWEGPWHKKAKLARRTDASPSTDLAGDRRPVPAPGKMPL